MEALGALVDSTATTAAEVNATLAAESEHEVQMRLAHGHKWNLLESGDAGKIRADLAAAEECLPSLYDEHASLRADLEQVADKLAVLDLPLEALAEQIPTAGGSPLAQQPCTLQLREALDSLDELRTTHDELLMRFVTFEGQTLVLELERNAEGRVGMVYTNTPKGALGVVVQDVVAGMPCEAAGVRVDDRILSVNDVRAEDHQQVAKVMADTPVGTPIEIVIHRTTEDQVRRRAAHTPAAVESPTLPPRLAVPLTGLAPSRLAPSSCGGARAVDVCRTW